MKKDANKSAEIKLLISRIVGMSFDIGIVMIVVLDHLGVSSFQVFRILIFLIEIGKILIKFFSDIRDLVIHADKGIDDVGNAGFE